MRTAAYVSPATYAPLAAPAVTCFHCGEPLAGSTLTIRVGDRDESVCCQGCRAVAELITGAGLTDYYRLRDRSGARPDGSKSASDRWSALNRPEVAAQFIWPSGDLDTTTLAVDGLRCAACSWLIDRMLMSISGVAEATTNAATGRTHVRWKRGTLGLGDVTQAIAELGYRPHPLSDESALQAQQSERRDALKRLAVAGFGMMQVMMFAIAVYSADLAREIMDPALLVFFRNVSLLVATPVMFYAGAPILASAWRNLQTRTLGMDIPVALALVLAYGASVYNTFWDDAAAVYFDSVTMFIFFLTLGRFIQMTVRHRTIGLTDAMARQLPAYARRIADGEARDVPVSALSRGDIVLVRLGEVLPADGQLLDADARIDEAMLTGESAPVRKRTGDRLAAGTMNVGGPIRLRIVATAKDTTLSHIVSLLQRAQTQKPALSTSADAAAARFLRYVLIGAGLTCALWLVLDPSRAFAATLAVLVVACPCAFAIATPAAISAATAHLARCGVLVTRIDAIETLARIDRIVFDKTGTLTRGDLSIVRMSTLAHLDESTCLQIAAALEVASEHPLARAFARFSGHRHAEHVRAVPGAGMEGIIDGQIYRIGTNDFVAQLRGASACTIAAPSDDTVVALGDETREFARFELRDLDRAGAASVAASLAQLRIEAQVLSGDHETAVAAAAERCGIQRYFARHSPERKLAHLQALQERGHCVAMIGDGVNDAPVLAAADLSIAMGQGSALAHTSADMILIADDLACLPEAIRLARRMLRIARQNLTWAAIYNFGSLPLAAAGVIPPWLAALGMSLSSVAVVLNAGRLLPRASGQPHRSPA
jgi:Cu2+-exporting ATPase